MVRKLASIRKISDIQPIEGADKICVYSVDGWKMVDTVGKYKIDELVVMCEIDSWIPTELAPFLSKGKEPREFEGVKGERLRTITLRGQISQGLLLPESVLITYAKILHSMPWQDGDDVTDLLGIKKWERPINTQLAGVVRGNFPSQIPKTDQERVQNLKKEIAICVKDNVSFEVTEKLEGSSMTCYLINGEFGVCSRNLDLKRDENNSFWKVAIEQNIEAKMREVETIMKDIKVSTDFAIQGELIGPGVQGNIYNLEKLDFYVFDVYDIETSEYLTPDVRQAVVYQMGLNHVPVLGNNVVLPETMDEILKYAEGTSVFADVEREGVVFKEYGGQFSFKAISNKYLMSEK